MRLHIANRNYSSWSLRPWVLMRTLGIPFEELQKPFEGVGPSPSFRTFSPTGKVPCLVDGAITVWDSLAIVEYLAESHPEVWPENKAARAFARSAAAEMHSGFSALRSTCSMNCGLRVKLPAISPALQNDLDRLAALWQSGLERFGGPFLAGAKFTAVDAFFAPVAFRVQGYALPLPPASQAYVDRLLALPVMREWYEAALREPWREVGHEEEVRAVGEILADLRGTLGTP